MAAPNPGGTAHFWNRDQEAYILIRNLCNLGSDYVWEDPVQHVWNAICRLYIPSVHWSLGASRWTVLREPYRGPVDSITNHRPDVLVMRLNQPVSGWPILKRDSLWIECKPPSHDKPSGWKGLFEEVVAQLRDAHLSRNVPVIAANGRRMMAFMWDPEGGFNCPQLNIQSDSPRSLIWYIDPRLKGVVGQWYDQNTGRIDLHRALELDCFTHEYENGQQVLKRIRDLRAIERIVEDVLGLNLNGHNPRHWPT